ncbi:MAG TPA: serine/threonine-protein kinase, partial [Chitinophagaceae bacterium]|nr:serine/threonine-protein kinase [Chitinophagaceae bacterium]
MARVFTITEGLENMGALKSGGQGSVYKARRVKEVVTAVKILPTPIHTESRDDKNLIAFENEVNKLKKVAAEPNPNVVKILSSGFTESGSFPFIEMEFIDGPDLEELLKPPHDPVFTIHDCIKVAVQLSCALGHCHKLDVKHGDVKSNNIKFNIHTGNYVLLDFGLALMSDEQRRTSLRQAGAIEFMAPEQNEGQMLFETDVYSFGAVLFELVAGVVPFPLKDKGETARTNVMIAHMETPPPDLLHLRESALPSTWNNEKRGKELQVPQWLLTTIYKCLEKDPANRFSNGIELHDYIKSNSLQSGTNVAVKQEQLNSLVEENKRLQQEKEQLLQSIQNEKRGAPKSLIPELNQQEFDRKRKRKTLPGYVYLLLLLGLSIFIFSVVKSINRNDKPQSKIAEPVSKPRRTIGQYKVAASRAYFHNEPKAETKRSAYMIPSNDVVNALDEENGFIYTEFTNNKGQYSKGWIR